MKRAWPIIALAVVAVALALVFRYLQRKHGMIPPVTGRISSAFGNRVHPITGETSFHNGIDFAVPEGTEVVSPADGEVRSVYTAGAGGLQLVIDHDNGFATGYAHLSRAEVVPGERVKQGQVIALTGNTGTTTGAHLHFTMRDASGQYVDPQPNLA